MKIAERVFQIRFCRDLLLIERSFRFEQSENNYMSVTPSTFTLKDFPETSTSCTIDSELKTYKTTHTSSCGEFAHTFTGFIYKVHLSSIHTLIYRQLHVLILPIIPIDVEFYRFTADHVAYFA